MYEIHIIIKSIPFDNRPYAHSRLDSKKKNILNLFAGVISLSVGKNDSFLERTKNLKL
jgi:hypothetical protein